MTNAVRTKMISTGPIAVRRTSPDHPVSSDELNEEDKRVYARAVKRIFDRESGELVGWLYEWNTGSLVPRWKAKAHEDVIYD